LPSGRAIRYASLHTELAQGDFPLVSERPRPPEWWYGQGRHRARIYAGKIDENIVQALARDVIAGQALDVFKSTGLRPALSVHDELVYVVPTSEATAALAEIHNAMRTPPTWWPQLVLWSEGGIGASYGAAK
jgi:DNA polymerase